MDFEFKTTFGKSMERMKKIWKTALAEVRPPQNRPDYSLTYLPTLENVHDAFGMFRLIPLTSSVKDDDLVLTEKVQKTDNMHMRTDYIMHPKSAIKKTDDGRFSVEAIRSFPLDTLVSLYFNPRFAGHFFNELPKRFLTQDGWDLFSVEGEEMLEAQSHPYTPCKYCHESTSRFSDPEFILLRGQRLSQTRSFKLKTPLQMLLKNTGMVITQIDHPCYHSLHDLLKHSDIDYSDPADPPTLTPIFPKDISF